MAQPKTSAQKPVAAPKSPAAPAVPVPPNADPPISAIKYGDWAVLCQHNAENTIESCEVSLTIQEKDQPGPIAKIALGRPLANGGIHVLVLLPTNISFPSSVEMKSDDKDAWSADIPWVRCITGACFAEIALTDADLIRWHSLDSTGKITFKDAAGRPITVAFSFHGLGQALDALTQHAH